MRRTLCNSMWEVNQGTKKSPKISNHPKKIAKWFSLDSTLESLDVRRPLLDVQNRRRKHVHTLTLFISICIIVFLNDNNPES